MTRSVVPRPSASRSGCSPSRSGTPGDWMPTKDSMRPCTEVVEAQIEDVDQIFEDFQAQPDHYATAMRAIESGREQVHDAVLFCGRFNQSGQLLRESDGRKPYRLVYVHGHEGYRKAQAHLRECWKNLPKKLREAQAKSEWKRYRAEKRTGGIRKAREDWGGFSGGGVGGFGAPYQSNSDLGSGQMLDPNQFTEFTPWFSGPFYKNIPYAYFPGMAAAREAINHHPIAKRSRNIIVQYAFGREFPIDCKDKELDKIWKSYIRSTNLRRKIRKHWGYEYFGDGELTINKADLCSIDASTIMDVVCEGWDEFIDRPLYLQQMYQTAVQTYAGINVPGVPKSKDSKPGKWIIRQIPADQVIRMKGNCTSQEKRGRPFIFDILGWLKKLKDTYTGKILAEQLQACFVYDVTVKGGPAAVAAEASKYKYIPVAPSIRFHNEAVEFNAVAPTAGKQGGGTDTAQELLALLATSMGFPKDFFNVMAQGSGSRATAIVGSEPFTKVIEDFQQDFKDLLEDIIEDFCVRVAHVPYNESDWKISFPSVSKDSAKDVIANIGTVKELGAYNDRMAAVAIAGELGNEDYDYDAMQAEKKADLAKYPPTDVMPGWQVPGGRFGAGPLPAKGGEPEPTDDSPIHGGKQAIKDQHKNL